MLVISEGIVREV